MTKNSFLGLLSLSIIVLASCNQIKDVVNIDFSKDINTGTFEVPAAQAGQQASVNKEVSNTEIQTELKNRNINTNLVSEVKVDSVKLTIPSGVDLDFSAVESATLSIDDKVIGSLPANATGKVAVFVPSGGSLNLKSEMLNKASYLIKFNGKMKKNTPAVTLTGTLYAKFTM